MPSHLLLVAPSANRVYADAAPRLMRSELLSMAAAGVLGPVREISEARLGGVPYLRIDTDSALPESGIVALSSASSALALFRLWGRAEGADAVVVSPAPTDVALGTVPDSSPPTCHTQPADGADGAARSLEQGTSSVLLEPVELRPLEIFPSDLVTIQKYPGKTNEHFTKLLLNVTAMATSHPERLFDRTLRVLDPMCGRGTTLNQALAYGLSCTGVEIDAKDREAYETFLLTWLKNHRFKHSATREALTRNRKHRGRRFAVELAPDKDAFRAGHVLRLDYLGTDTTALEGLLRPASFDVVVTDTPYGVQHGSQGDRLARSPVDLLAAALPGWARLLRTGGAIGMAYNRHVADPIALEDLLSRNGFHVVDPAGPDGFRHRVDQSIDRDLVVARTVAAAEPRRERPDHG